MIVVVIQTEVERLEVSVRLHEVLDTAVRRGVEGAAGDLVNTDLPVPGERRPCEGHGEAGVGGEGGDGGVHVHVLAVIVTWTS